MTLIPSHAWRGVRILADVNQPPQVPDPDLYAHLKTLGTIARLATSLSDLTPPGSSS